MRILVAGSGGREHALAWACARHPSRPEVICAPGNAGTALAGENVAVAATDPEGISRLAVDRGVDLVIVGPDNALAAGVADAVRRAGVACFGPGAAAARIESSKWFAKELMDAAGVPTAAWRAGGRDDRSALFDFVVEQGGRCVVKADGLALGKGVAVCDDIEEATSALNACLKERRFGDAGDIVIVEERLQGPELSVFALSDGERVRLLANARDHKRAYDRDLGPNTGGMGAYAPALDDASLLEEIERRCIQPVVDALREAGARFIGCLYAGLMLTKSGPVVLEYNARFGDPETQVIAPLAGETLLDHIEAAANRRLERGPVLADPGAAVVVVAAVETYPAPGRTGDVITGLDSLDPEALCFHAGTARNERGDVVTAGGRVLGVTGLGPDIAAARRRAYDNIDRISFDGMRLRRDIAAAAAGAAVD